MSKKCMKLIIGSSNVQRFFNQKLHEGVGLIQCVWVEEFKVRLASLLKTQKIEAVAISVIDNFLCDALGAMPDQKTFDQKVGLVCQEFVDCVKVYQGCLIQCFWLPSLCQGQDTNDT